MNKIIRKNLPQDWAVLVTDGDKSSSLSNNLKRELIKVEKNLRRSCRKSSTNHSGPLLIVFTFKNGPKLLRRLLKKR
jgi:hypothetical protein